MKFLPVVLFFLFNAGCSFAQLKVGAERFDQYLSLLQDKNVALVVNQSSLVEKTHLVDTLLSYGVNVKKIMAPEHGFRGKADAGESVKDDIDQKTGLPIISLYGKHKKPVPDDLKDIDVVVFDLQDVGVRFYTYISTMHYVMEACAENNIKFLVLDRPNPNGHYVDGPVLESGFKSFVGMHRVPVVHGMTIAEYARMINEEGWLSSGVKCDLSYVACEEYDHQYFYELPVRPSPNLPNIRAIYLYPSLCFFEGTQISLGRGTDFPFQVYGHPDLKGDFQFTPESKEGARYHPKHQGKVCNGVDLRDIPLDQLRQNKRLNLGYLLKAYHDFPDKDHFFLENNFINKLAGTDKLKKQIIEGRTEQEIRASWQDDIEKFRQIRKKYLLYKDFE